MELQTRIELYALGLGALSFIYGTLRGFKKDVEKRFDGIDQRFEKVDALFDKVDQRFDKVDYEIKELREDVSEIKERMSFLEAANIYTMPSEPSPPNARSMAAIRMHQRRKQKKLTRKE